MKTEIQQSPDYPELSGTVRERGEKYECPTCEGEGWAWVAFCVPGKCPLCGGSGMLAESSPNTEVSD